MANITRLTFEDNLDSTVNVGDTVYYCPLDSIGGFNVQLDENDITKLGTVLKIHSNVMMVTITTSNPMPSANDFIFTVKDEEVNVNSLKGYFAEVKMKNTSTEKAELFRITLGYSDSSK